MSGTRMRRAFFAALVSCLPAVALAALPSSLAPSLDSARFASADRNVETILHVPALGRYALTARSAVGASVELVDRMAGTIATAAPGAGASANLTRLDSFLEPGDYKVRISKQAQETVDLAVARFVTANAGLDETAVPVLTDGQSVDGELHDLQLSSWWIRVDASNPSIIIEARGRNLADAALWKDGTSDAGVRPSRRILETQAGKPVVVLELNATVEPGLYLLVCAGTSRLPWAKESAAEPFSVTRGAPLLGDLGMMKVTIPERGTMSFLVSGDVGSIQMEASNTKGYRLMTGANTPGSSRYDAEQEATIDAKSASLRCTVRGAGGGGATDWVTLQGPPGETVEVRWLGLSGSQSWNGLIVLQPFPASASYLTTVMSAAEGQDSIDASGMILQTTRVQNKMNIEPRAVQAVGLAPDKPLRRRVNATARLSFLLLPQKRGGYSVAEKDSSASARYQFALLDDVLTGGSTSPIELKGGGRIDLKEKLYLVTILPVKAGILDFAIVPTSLFGRAKTGDIFSSAAPAGQNEIWWPSTSVIQGGTGQATLLLGARESIPLGVQVRQLPLEIERTAAVRVDPSKPLSLPFTCTRDIRVFSTSPAFGPSNATIDGIPWRADLVVAKGAHTLVITNRSARPEWHVIGAVPPDSTTAGPPPRFPDIDSLFPAFSAGSPVWRSFERGETLSFLLKVKEPGSYRVSTAGRLAMGITVRTFLRPSLVSASQNADGRNAVLTAYLRPGTYLVQATAQGSSRGRAGVTLEPITVIQTTALRAGATVRATVPGAAVMRTEVRVDHDGDYSLECLGLGRGFPWRLEDADGWPIGAPDRSGILSGHLDAGTYRYVSMADPVETRRLVSLSTADPGDTYDPKAKKLALRLNRTYQKTWVEQAGRPEDVFSIELPADIHAVLTLPKGMTFRVLGSDGSPAYQGLGGKPLGLDLARGSWRIAVASVDEDNLKRYEISLATEDLFVGESRRVAPAFGMVPISIGSGGTAEIWSYGGNELEAALVDDSGKLVARGETIQDDWNFRIVAGVAPGRYRLFYYSPLATQVAAPQPTASAQAESPQASSGDDEEVTQDENTEDESGTVAEDQSEEESNQDQPAVEQGEEAEEHPSGQEEQVVVTAQPPAAAGSSEIRMIVRAETSLPAVTGSLETRVDLADEVAVVKLTSRENATYRFTGTSTTAVTVAVLREGKLLASAPSPLFLPLSAGGVYTLRYWRTSEQKSEVVLHAAAEKAVTASTAGTIDARASVLCLTFPAGASLHLDNDSGQLLFSGGADLPFEALTDAAVSTVAGTGWVVKADGSTLGACRVAPLALAGGAAEALAIGAFEGGFDIQVPARSVALVRTDNAGKPAGLSASPRASSPAGDHDWRGAHVDSRSSVLGLREGAYRGRVWETDPVARDPGGAAAPSNRRIVVAAEVYPVVSESSISNEDRSLTVAPGSAVALNAGGAGSAGRLTVTVSLERGMAAFAWQDAPAGIVDAADGPITGTLDVSRGSVVVVNRARAPGLCVIRRAASAESPELGDGPGFESLMGAGGSVSFTVKTAAAGGRVFVWGPIAQARYLSDADGRIYRGEPVESEIEGLLGFPAGRGKLEVTSAGGPLKVWRAPPDSVRAPFVARDSRAGESALPPQGGVLTQAAQAWSFSLDAPSIVSVKADGDGVAALFDRSGACLRATASAVPVSGRRIMAMLLRGSYSVFTRSFRGAAAQAGVVTMRVLTPVDLTADGEGVPSLIGQDDAALYRFRVSKEGRVGCGIRVQTDGLSATLLDEGFRPLGIGQIFVRDLKPGLYYLLVGSGGGTQRYTPVVYGMAGNDMDIPDDVIRGYRGE